MKKLFIICLFLFLTACGNRINEVEAPSTESKAVDEAVDVASLPEEVTKQVGELKISVDPRVELNSIISLLREEPSENPAYFSNPLKTEYRHRVLDYFSAYSNHEAIDFSDDLIEFGLGFISIEPPLHMTNQFKRIDDSVYSYYLEDGLGEAKIQDFFTVMEKSVHDTNFNQFFEENRATYGRMIDESIHTLDGQDVIQFMHDYYGMKKASYNLIFQQEV